MGVLLLLLILGGVGYLAFGMRTLLHQAEEVRDERTSLDAAWVELERVEQIRETGLEARRRMQAEVMRTYDFRNVDGSAER